MLHFEKVNLNLLIRLGKSVSTSALGVFNENGCSSKDW